MQDRYGTDGQLLDRTSSREDQGGDKERKKCLLLSYVNKRKKGNLESTEHWNCRKEGR